MLDTMLDTYSKAVESTFKLQQEMLSKLTAQWTPSQPQAAESKPAPPTRHESCDPSRGRA